MDVCKQCLWWWCVFILSILHSSLSADLTYQIPEEQAVNTFIGNILNDTDHLGSAINVDDHPNLQFSFLTEGNSITTLFTLNKNTGDLNIGPNTTLDREVICPFALKCDIKLDVVVQSPLNQLFRKVSVIIILEDINDNPPTFTTDILDVDISEAVLVGASIPIEGASDRDKGTNNSLQAYEIVPSDGAFGVYFRKNIDGTSYLNLVIIKELDHETKNKYALQIIAKDGGNPPLQGILRVNVMVTDVNDNIPKFTNDNYSVTVDENISQNSIILNIHASDLDSGENADIIYKLSSHQDRKILELFHIDSKTGNMSVRGDLQSEATEKYSVIVEASDHALQPFTIQTVVTVNVRDVINSPPKLTVNLLSGGAVSEYANTGTVIAHVAIMDSDRGRNGIVTCQLQSEVYFQLQAFDVDEYKIIVAKKLDSELTQRHNVTIICQDAGAPGLTAIFSSSLKVIDENDNSPVFMKTKYSTSISENNKIGQSVLTVYATDNDSGSNGRIRYLLTSDSGGQFLMSPEDGVIRTNMKFDYESQQYANFTVLAVDSGKPSNTATSNVLVAILDVNDEYPKFSQETYLVIVSEMAKPGDIVTLITAFDFESGKNGELEYFRIDKTPFTPFTLLINGSLILDQSLDYEKQQVYAFDIIAMDRGTPRLNTSTRVVVQVKDENDNIPIITFPTVSNYLINVTFYDKKGTVITRLRVTDLDSGLNGELHYIITSRNDSGRFEIDSVTGEIYTTRNYNENDINLYRLVISVKDKGNPPLVRHTTVSVKLSKGNGTSATHGVDSNEKNILITLTIVCVTIVISAIIVLIIVIIRHRDRKRQNVPLRQTHRHNEPSKYDEIIKSNNINKLKSNVVDDFGFHVTSEKSFVQQNPSCLDNKPPSMNQSKANTSFTSQKDSVCQETNVMNESTVLQLHNNLLQNYKQTQGSGLWSINKPVTDDANSVASGETTTSDSGRGGSEEDINSHNGTQTMDEADLSRVSRNNNYQATATSTNPIFKSDKHHVRNSSRKHVTFRDSKLQKQSHPNNTPSSRDINPTNRDVDLYNKACDWRIPNILRAENPHKSVDRTYQDNVRNRDATTNNSSRNNRYYVPVGNDRVIPNNEYIPMTGGNSLTLDWRNDSILPTGESDDRSTTTSGSYTLDNDDRFGSLDYNEWKDVVV